MTMAAPGRSSLFTFESSVHPSHVLRSLDEQRQRDILCDVTVVTAEGPSFRAHRSVLASCSEYFSQRSSSFAQSALMTLPPEVTAAGFEPLLKFAYTSKLLFGKENVLDIQTSATVLGFKDLDGACFDFLLPKFFSSTKASFVRKTCCKKKCQKGLPKDTLESEDVQPDDKEEKTVADSLPSQEEVSFSNNKSVNIKMGNQSIVCPTTPLTAVREIDNIIPSPKYRKFQLACGKEANAEKKSQQNPVIKYFCDSPCSSKSKTGSCPLLLATPVEDLFDSKKGDFYIKTNKTEEKYDEELQEIEMQEQTQNTNVSCNVKGIAMEQGNESSRSVLLECPQEIIGSLGQPRSAMDLGEEGKKTRDICAPENGYMPKADEQWQEKGSIMERVEPQGNAPRETKIQDLDDECSLGNSQSTSLDLLKIQLNLSPTLLHDLDQGTSGWKCPQLSECASQSGLSSLNSGEDSETEAEGYNEAYVRERAKQVQLPYPVDQIVEMSRNDFQELLEKQPFTREQLDLVRDMRRRSKNRLAAQRCRKRKLDCIYNLQCEINKLKTEREKLIHERSQLSQMKLKTCHSVSVLCQRVCGEANLQPEQLQVLAKFTSVECPLASYVPFIDSLLSSQHQQSTHLSPSGGDKDMPQTSTDRQYSGNKT